MKVEFMEAVACFCATLLIGQAAFAQGTAKLPWMNQLLTSDKRADLVLKQITLDEKIQLVHGVGWAALIPGHHIPTSPDY